MLPSHYVSYLDLASQGVVSIRTADDSGLANVSDTAKTFFSFEEEFQRYESYKWIYRNWSWSLILAAAYVGLVFLGQWYMRDREPFKLKGPLVFWNFGLAVFSTVGAARTLPELFESVYHHSFYHSVCIPSYYGENNVTACWTWLFAMSKVPELLDTAFIVLRKQRLIFLHWYHHATVLMYTWYSFAGYTASGRWFISMNFTVHALMYTYYMLRAMKVHVPRTLAMLITVAQIAQMFLGIVVNARAAKALGEGSVCSVTQRNITVSMLMYATYFMLFVNFFIAAYTRRSQRRQVKKVQ